MATTGFLTLIRDEFQDLLESGTLRLDNATDHDARSFGNEFAVLTSENLGLKVPALQAVAAHHACGSFAAHDVQRDPDMMRDGRR